MTTNYENPMSRKLTDKEEWSQMSDSEREELDECTSYKGKILNKFKGFKIHPSCWEEGREN